MVWNVTKDEIRERMAVINHHSWNPPAAYPPEPVKAEDRVGYSPEIEAGRYDVRRCDQAHLRRSQRGPWQKV